MHNSATNFNMYSMYWKKQNGKVSAVMTSTVLDFFFCFFVFFVSLFFYRKNSSLGFIVGCR